MNRNKATNQQEASVNRLLFPRSTVPSSVASTGTPNSYSQTKRVIKRSTSKKKSDISPTANQSSTKQNWYGLTEQIAARRASDQLKNRRSESRNRESSMKSTSYLSDLKRKSRDHTPPRSQASLTRKIDENQYANVVPSAKLNSNEGTMSHKIIKLDMSKLLAQ